MRDSFIQSVYSTLADDSTNDRANQIIDAFDNATETCIELPCQVGDTVYTVDFDRVNEYEVVGICYFKRQNTLKCILLVEIQTGIHGLTARSICIDDDNRRKLYGDFFPVSEIGQTVFLAEDEAKELLRKRTKQ